MEIQQLRVKITAETSGLNKALKDLKGSLAALSKDANGAEGALNKMGDSAASSANKATSSINKATAAVTKMIEQVNEVGRKMKDALNFKNLIDYSQMEKGKLPDIDTKDLRGQLAQAQKDLADIYAKMDETRFKIDASINSNEIVQLWQELDKAGVNATDLEDKIKAINQSLIGMGDDDGVYKTTQQIEDMKVIAYKMAEALVEAKKKLYELRVEDDGFGSEALTRAEQQVARLTSDYQKLIAEIKVMQQEAQNVSVEIEPSGFERFKNALSSMGGVASKAGSAIRKIGSAAKTATKGITSMYKGLVKAMAEMNPIPKIANKLGNAFSSLWNKIKTAFIFSVINSWFNNFKQQVSSYLATNNELQSALSGFRGAALTAFQPIYDVLVPALIKLVQWATAAASAIARLLSLISGKSVSSMRANAKALNEQAKATSAAGGAAKEAAKTIAAFDELNVLNGDKDSGGGGGGDDGTAIEFPEIEEAEQFDTWGEWFSDLLDKLIAKLPQLDAALQKAAEGINNFSGNLLEMFTFDGVRDKVGQLGSGLAEVMNHFWDAVDWYQLGEAGGAGIDLIVKFLLDYVKTRNWTGIGSHIAEGINGAVSRINWSDVGALLIQGWNVPWQTFNGFVSKLDWKQLGSSISSVITSAVENLDLASVGSALSHTVKGILDLLCRFFEDTDWYQLGQTIVRKIGDLFTNIDWTGIIESAFELLGAAIAGSLQLAAGIGKAIIEAIVNGWHSVKSYFDERIQALGGDVLGGILFGIIDAIAGIGAWIKTHIFEPFIKGFKKAFGIASPAKEMVPLGKNIIEGLLNGIKEAWENLKQWFTEAFDNMKQWCKDTWEKIKTDARDKWTNIKTTITDKANDIKDKVKEKFDTLKTNLATVSENTKTELHNKWEGLKTDLVGIGESISEKVKGAFDALKEGAISAFNGLKEGIKSPINSIIGFINSLISGVVSGINSMISALNSVKFTAPDWVPLIGGKSFGLNIPSISAYQIPTLAKGGVITDPTMAIMGEYAGAHNNPEIAAPQSVLKDTMVDANAEMVSAMYQMAQQLIAAIEGMNMEVKIGDDVIAESAKRGSDSYFRRTGQPMFAT